MRQLDLNLVLLSMTVSGYILNLAKFSRLDNYSYYLLDLNLDPQLYYHKFNLVRLAIRG